MHVLVASNSVKLTKFNISVSNIYSMYIFTRVTRYFTIFSSKMRSYHVNLRINSKDSTFFLTSKSCVYTTMPYSRARITREWKFPNLILEHILVQPYYCDTGHILRCDACGCIALLKCLTWRGFSLPWQICGFPVTREEKWGDWRTPLCLRVFHCLPPARPLHTGPAANFGAHETRVWKKVTEGRNGEGKITQKNKTILLLYLAVIDPSPVTIIITI
jgi:hypothetical protein